MKKYFPELITGFVVGVLNTVGFFRSISCCLLIPLAVIFAIFLHKKSTGKTNDYDISEGIFIGFITALFAAFFATFFEVTVTFIFKSNDLVNSIDEIYAFVKDFPQTPPIQDMLKQFDKMVIEITEYGFSLKYTVLLLINNILGYTVFGILGGLLGTKLINKKNQNLS